MRSPGQLLAEWFLHQLTRPRREYRRVVFNDPERLKSRIRPGDVVLVDGDQRVSQVVKYLTMSPWSHSALYVGSALLRDPARRAEVRRRFGKEARYLIVEALVDRGVVVSPLVKYIDFNIRVCRPHGLTKEQIETVVALRPRPRRVHLRPAQHLRPLPLPAARSPAADAPARGRPALRQREGHRDDLLLAAGRGASPRSASRSSRCTSGARPPCPAARGSASSAGRRAAPASGFLKARHPSLCVPQDFDLSPVLRRRQVQCPRPDPIRPSSNGLRQPDAPSAAALGNLLPRRA